MVLNSNFRDGRILDKNISQRKTEHLKGALKFARHERHGAFDDYTVIHNALPEINLEDVDTSLEFLGKKIAAPLMIGSITGGPDNAEAVNKNLARAAQSAGVPLSLGSAKIVFKKQKTRASFDVRALCPDVPLLLNLGLADLEESFSVSDCARLCADLAADALIFHINPLHEAVQKNGNTRFAGLADRLARAVNELEIPVIVKEVGHGISPAVFEKLDALGVYAIDIAGAGGTSWGFIEGYRAKNKIHKKTCDTYADWGLPTARILEMLQANKRKSMLIASGGVRSGVDVFKSLCLGADMAAAALPFLKPALSGRKAVEKELNRFITELRLAMFASGCRIPRDARPGLLL